MTALDPAMPGPARTQWPIPDRVGVYGDEATFRAARPQSGQWVFWTDRVELVLQGRYDDVRPLHVELSPTYLCNFACPWCSCRSAREDWAESDVFNHPRATPLTVMRESRIDHVLGHLAPDRVGIMWVGGEPTMNPLLYPAAGRARALGLPQCLFTNGSLLNPARIEALFDAGFVFIRLSLNAVSPDVHRTHHDYDPRRDYAARVLANLDHLARTRATSRSDTMVGVSVVVDERNLDDLGPTVEHLCRLAERYGPGSVDYAIFRPAFPFYTAQVELLPDTTRRFLTVLADDSPARRRMREAGIDVVVPEASTGTDEADTAGAGAAGADDGMGCLSAGWFGEVAPSGDLLVCSDRYGHPDYVVGNLADRSVDELWSGAGRRKVLDLARNTNCYGTQCPRNGRGYYLNRVFRDIETHRRRGELQLVRDWIADLRTVLTPPSHSFFL